jgi:hypothetical protein
MISTIVGHGKSEDSTADAEQRGNHPLLRLATTCTNPFLEAIQFTTNSMDPRLYRTGQLYSITINYILSK